MIEWSVCGDISLNAAADLLLALHDKSGDHKILSIALNQHLTARV